MASWELYEFSRGALAYKHGAKWKSRESDGWKNGYRKTRDVHRQVQDRAREYAKQQAEARNGR